MMTATGNNYAEALFMLAREENSIDENLTGKTYLEFDVHAIKRETVTLNINAAGIDPNNKLTMEIGLLGADITFYVRNYNLVQN